MPAVSSLTERRVWSSPTVLRRVRKLPFDGQVLVREGRVVRIDDVVAATERPLRPVLVRVAAALGLRAEPVEPYLLRKPGDSVSAGDVLARRKRPLGIGSRTCLSPVSGKLVSGPAGSGDYMVIPASEPVEIRAHYPGVISAVIPLHGVVVRTTAIGAQGLVGCGGEGGGPIRVIAGALEPISPGRLIARLTGAVVVGGSADLATLRRAAALELGAIVVGSVRASVYEAYLAEAKKVPLLVLDAFGTGGMSEFIHELLRTREGAEARVTTGEPPLGLTSDGQPPEIVIPVNEGEAHGDRPIALDLNSRVRITAGPDAIADGLVTAIGKSPAALGPDLIADWVEVTVEGKQPVRVPIANLELMAGPS